jgi:hypothetical protein
MAAAAASTGAVTWDFLQGLVSRVFGEKVGVTAIRQSVNRYMRLLALDFERQSLDEMKGDVIVPWEQERGYQERRREVRKWLQTQPRGVE